MHDTTAAYRLSDGQRADIFVLEKRLYVRIGRIAIQFGPNIDNERIVLEHARGIGQPDTIRLASNERAGRGSAD